MEKLRTSETPLPRALNEVLLRQHRYYKRQLNTWEYQHQQHQTFMNQWVSISEETDRLKHGLEMVLYMARRETFEQDFHVHQVSLRELVNDVIRDNRRSFIRNYVYPEIQIDPELKVETDAKWMRFIVQQLISNAIKYSAGSREKVTLSAYRAERAVILEVQDHGVGIPKSDLTRVCDAFYTGENGRVYKESTGMGLYLVKESIEKLKGTLVRIIFPYAAG